MPTVVCVDMKEASDEMPLIVEQLEQSNHVFPMQTLSRKSSNSNGVHHQHSSDSEEAEAVDTVIQDYIDQVAATNLKQRRTSFAENKELATLAIPDVHPQLRSGNDSGNQQLTPGSRDREVRFSPTTPVNQVSSVPATPRTSALKKVSQITPEPTPEPLQDEILPSMNILDVHDVENQREQTLKSEKELNHAKKLLRLAFVEFYRGLGLLSNYRYVYLSS